MLSPRYHHHSLPRAKCLGDQARAVAANRDGAMRPSDPVRDLLFRIVVFLGDDALRPVASYCQAGAGPSYQSFGARRRTAMMRRHQHIDALCRAAEWLEGWGIGLYLSLIYGWMVEALASSGRYEEAAQTFKRSVEQRGVEGEHLGSAVAARALARAAAQARPTCLSNSEHYLECARDFAVVLIDLATVLPKG